MANSALSYSLDPNQYDAGSYTDFYNQYGRQSNNGAWIDADPNSFFGKVNNFFLGTDASARDAYDRKQVLLDRQYEQANLASSRAWDEYFDSTKYQRAVADLKAAGLNPLLAIQNGLSGSSSSAGNSVSGSQGTSSRKLREKKDLSSNILTSALKVLMMFALMK